MARGRPKKFDDKVVLEKAMEVFWRKGFDSTTLNDIDQATQIPRQSLYRAFKNKRILFLNALDYYQNRVVKSVLETLEKDRPAIENLELVFTRWQNAMTQKQGLGCLMGNTAAQFLPDDVDVRNRVLAHQDRLINSLEKALAQGQSEGSVNVHMNPKSMARMIISTVNGLLSISRVGPPQSIAQDVLQTLMSLIQTK